MLVTIIIILVAGLVSISTALLALLAYKKTEVPTSAVYSRLDTVETMVSTVLNEIRQIRLELNQRTH